MKSNNQKIVMYESDEAAQVKTLTGWVSREGIYWGDNEHQARWGGCTHKTCECGNMMSKHYLKCDSCRTKSDRENYLKLPFKEYNGEPVVIRDTDTYFFSEDEIVDYLEDNDLKEVDLLFCDAQEWTPISSDVWQDIMPDEEDFLPEPLQAALDNLNQVIETLLPCSYFPGKVRTTYKS